MSLFSSTPLLFNKTILIRNLHIFRFSELISICLKEYTFATLNYIDIKEKG
ncbi:hypothetical protein D1872_111400 [compost metagenome]